MADRIAIMNDGILQQVGTPDEVYHHPANLFVAQFVGSPVMNIAPVSITAKGDALEVSLGSDTSGFEFPQELAAQIKASTSGSGDLTLGIRPEGVQLSRTIGAGFVPSQVHLIEPLGAYDIVDLKFGNTLLRARTKSGFAGRTGEQIWARLDPSQTHFFNSKSGDSLHIRLGNGAN